MVCLFKSAHHHARGTLIMNSHRQTRVFLVSPHMTALRQLFGKGLVGALIVDEAENQTSILIWYFCMKNWHIK